MSTETIFFSLKLPSFLQNIAKIRLICLQNKSGFKKLALMIYTSVIDHIDSFKVGFAGTF